MRVIGMNMCGFCTSAALLEDGVPIFATEEERLTREKRTRKFPISALNTALEFGKVDVTDIDYFSVAWNPGINLEVFSAANSGRNRYLGELLFSVPNNLLTLPRDNKVESISQSISLQSGHSVNIHFVTHHMAHASAFLYSPFEEAAILTVDGFGEAECTTFSLGRDNQIKKVWSQEFPHSLAYFYSAITEYCGFNSSAGEEWKLMGASAYGDPDRFAGNLRALITMDEKAGMYLALNHFNHYQFHRPNMFTSSMENIIGIPPNNPNNPLTQEYCDLAASAQYIFEESYFALMHQLHAYTGVPNLVVSGGAALNSLANGKILTNTPFSNVYIPPVPDDSGGALNSAIYTHCCIKNKPRNYIMKSNYLGPEYSEKQIETSLKQYKYKYRRLDNLSQETAELIANGKIIGWLQGRLEYGDRALGNRSILADPRDPSMKDQVNSTIKYREPFRPFAPSILAEETEKYFVDSEPTPFMEKVYKIRPEKRGIVPAVTHEDGTGRLQTVTREQNPIYYSLIEAFRDITGIPILLNTSFNLKGEPIVCSPEDALRTFATSGLDAIVMNNFLLEK